ncbi:hypothetical protein DFH08DRAFT_820801 [Mycena albidolilacea]|uniref:Uncharacterized protein n=1 Tax=Mycena albidolilacea TaxID=1033008 RepID=A0AAD6ZCN3_9AGAR|nr:hypothetical protein DFH08DRAFT_820801 [Mycena albidolilacea]
MSKKRMNDHAKNKGHLKAKEEKERVKRHRTSRNRMNHSQSNDVPTDTAELHGETSGSNCSHDPLTPNATVLAANPIVEPIPDSEDPTLIEPVDFSRFGWTDSSGKRVYFSAGDADADRDLLAESLARALRGGHTEQTFGEAEYLEDLDKQDPLFCPEGAEITAEELNINLFGPDSKSEWFPYPDKGAFLMDVLFSSPRLRFSRAQQKSVLSWAKELGAQVPSYNGFRQTQDALLTEVGNPTKRQQSGRGNVWYLNEISDSIKKDMSNPFTRSGMALYPDDAGNKLEEVWNGDKMLRDVPDHLLSPTIRHNSVIYYVNELVQCSDGSWFLPKRWLTRDGGKVMLASGFCVTERDDGSLIIQDETRELVEVSTFQSNILQILERTSGIYPSAAESHGFADEMPHPLREKAGSRMVYSIPLAIFIDDVSGNKSKQWNKHFSCYMSNGAVPRTKLENEFHVRFVATSPFASPLEIIQGVRASIEYVDSIIALVTVCGAKSFHVRDTFDVPVAAWDYEGKEEVLLRPYGLLFAGDNPMQAELCSCAGLNTNYFCRTCKAGGTRDWKQSNEGFAAVLKPGEMRDSAHTAEETFQQILTALEPNIATTLTEAVRSSGVKDALAQPIIDSLVKMGMDLRKANPEGSSHSPDEVQALLTEELKKHQLQGEGINMHKDTPTEILHTILLGVVKYYWGQTVWLLEKGKDFSLFQTRLNSVLADGLNIPKIQADYMCQYKGGLIGKHFKTLSQIMAFAVEGLVPPDVLEAWLILGRLTFLLWHTDIDDIESYTLFYSHEAYNAVFRACSIYSNRLTPSRDIAWSFAGIDRVKHIGTGGWWKDSRTQKWTCANPRVMRHILDHPEMAAMVGLPTKVIREPGIIIPYPDPAAGKETLERKISWSESMAGQSKSTRFPVGAADPYRTSKGLVICTGDKVFVGHTAIIRREGDVFLYNRRGKFSPLSFGTIREIVVPVTSPRTGPKNSDVKITVQLFAIEPTLHARLHIPVLVRTNELFVVLPEDVECGVNLQHDCYAGKCGPHNSVSILQEREATTITRARIRHTDDSQFILNTTALHNYRQIASAIPPSIPAHSFTVPDQCALRASAAAQIRDKIAGGGGDSDDPMSRISIPEEPLQEPDQAQPDVEMLADPDGEDASGELEPRPAQPSVAFLATVLEAPAFSHVGARGRKQHLK